MSPDEWQQHQEEIRLKKAEGSPEFLANDASVQEIRSPSVQFIPIKRRGPGRPRKERHLVVDLTVHDILPGGDFGASGSGSGSGNGSPP